MPSTTSGYETADVQRLRDEVQQYRALQAGVRGDLDKCRWEPVGSEKSCEVQAWNWRQAIVKSRGIEVKWASEAGKALIEVRSRYAAAGTLVAQVNGQDIPLDAFKIFPGANQVMLAKISGPTNAQQLYSEAPLTISLAMLIDMLDKRQPDDPPIQRVEVGCFGAVAYGSTVVPVLSVQMAQSPTLFPDNICAGPQPFIRGLGLYGGIVYPGDLMPIGLESLHLDTPRGKVSLKLQLVDSYGFVTEHLLTSDLAKQSN